MKLRKWFPKYNRLARQFADQHFGGWNGVLRLFTYMNTPNLNWPDSEELPADVYFVRKMANEYHGLERHAQQYHVTAQYDYAYHHWLMAACWRRENMVINNFTDERHLRAVDFDLACAFYNKALFNWFSDGVFVNRKSMPQPYEFGIREKILIEKDIQAQIEIDEAFEPLLKIKK